MKVSPIKVIFNNSLYIIWAVFVAALFTLYSGTLSHSYGSSIANWPGFAKKLLQIDIFLYSKDLFFSFTGMACFTLACISLGSLFINRPEASEKLSYSGWVGNFVTAFLLGEIALSFILLELGVLESLSRINTFIVLLTGAAAGMVSFKNFLKAYPKNRYKGGFISKSESVMLWLSLMILASTIFLTPARISYDSTALYFSGSKLTAMINRFIFFQNEGFVVSAFHTGILYTALIQIAGDQAARFLSWISGLFIILISMALADEIGLSCKSKLIALALLVTSTAFMDPFGDGKIELSATLTTITAIFWLVKAEKGDYLKNYILAGIFAGFSIISRPYNLVLLGGFIALLFFVNKTPLLPRVKNYITLSIPILIMVSLHLTANWLILGDFLAPLHNTAKVTPEIWQWSGFDPEYIWVARIFFPLVATFLNTPQSMGNITPIILIFLPVFFSRKARNNLRLSRDLIKISLISFFILTTWIMVYFTIFEIRYVFFLWIIICLAAAEMISASLETLEPFNQKVFSGIIVLLLLYMCGRNVFIAVDAYAPIDENGAPQCNDSPFCSYLSPLNQNAAQGDRVLGLSAFRYYFRPDLFACSSKADEYLIIRNALKNSKEDFWVEVHNQGYRYIAYEENYSMRHQNIDFLPTISAAPSWVKLEKLSETFDGYFSTYKIEYINAPNQINKKCVIDNGIWLVQDIP
jgi:hypothetical protein